MNCPPVPLGLDDEKWLVVTSLKDADVDLASHLRFFSKQFDVVFDSNRGGGHSVRKRCRTAFSYWVGVIALDHNPLDFIEAHLVAPAIVELGRARRGVVRHRRGLFERAAVLQIGGDTRRSEAVVAQLGGDTGCRSAPADHRIGVRLW